MPSSRRAGRRPLPSNVRELFGNRGHRARPAGEPEPPADPPVMPKWLRLLDVDDAGLGELTIAELKQRAAALGIAGRSKLKAREQLEAAILEAQPGPREEAWNEIAPVLEEMKVLSTLDVHVLALTVDRYVSFIEVRRAVAELGPTYETVGRYGVQVKRRPEVEMAQSLWEQTVKGLVEFGATPASRTKVAVVPKGGDQDPLDQLRSQRSAG